MTAFRSVDPDGGGRGWSALWGVLGERRLRITALSVVSFGGAMSEAGILVFLTNAVLAIAEGRASVEMAGQMLPLAAVLGVVAGMVVLRLVLALVGVTLSANLNVRVLDDLRSRLAQAYLRADWEIQHAQPSGRLQEILTTFVNHAINAVSAFARWITAGLSLAAFLTTAVVVDPLATVFVLIALALLAGVLRPLRQRIRRLGARDARTGLDFTKSVSELGSLGMEMQVFGVQGKFADLIRTLSRENARARYSVAVLSGALAPTYVSLAYGAVVAGVAILAGLGTANLVGVGAVILLMLRALSYGQGLQTASGQIAASLPYVARILATIAQYEEAAASGGTERPPSATPVVLESVRFAYTSEKDALTDVSLRIEANEVIGVIGPSGAGKSTLVQLLLGLRDPSGGVVGVGGADLRQVDRSWWANRVALVAQEAVLFTGTVAENIRFFRDGISAADVRQAAAQANLLGDIEALTAGFDTHLGERGSQLSGGQRQRLSIARALAGGPELLVLDEPTSALDVRSEALIRAALTELRGRTTVVIVAHRMSTLDICDRILVIEDGHATAFDTPANLYRSNSFYRNAMAISGITPADGTESSEPPERDREGE